MALEKLISEGDKQLHEKDYLSAIATFTSALKEAPKALQAFLKRATAYQKMSKYENAKRDIADAFEIANQRGKREDIGECYFKLGLVLYAEKDIVGALKNFERAVEYGCRETTASTWKTKVEYEVKKQQENKTIPEKSGDSPGSSSTSQAQPEQKVVQNTNSVKEKIKDDWYQSSDKVIITVYAKGVKESDVEFKADESSVSISFPTAAGSEYQFEINTLFSTIDPQASAFKVYSTKIEVSLQKKEAVKWSSLARAEEASTPSTEPSATPKPLSYPTSSKKAINWSSFDIQDEEEADKGETDFFAQLYKNTDDDTRRAMMKSYVESNGTVLTTNWEEARAKKFETSPPEGMVAKKWDNKT
ncbi:Piso0_005840 [Millerozyma farinosa CBS 7064]|uniref:Piso0_005840 protein n=1 Tax=Pichia sorbitophila (strain ATCC MYA-4447 / BCRC 22081 / CBS 7064 / NBRC 10061 / NRRL Y-12695) TaxID=559304 RepID=G8Y033_PICSO|nr:Piso0_005840 [Millerozyma farinosa CBS 7064]